MKHFIPSFFLTALTLVLAHTNSVAQYSSSSSVKISVGTVYDRESGRLLSEEELTQLITNGNPAFEPQMDQYGQASTFLIDTSNPYAPVNMRDISRRPQVGEIVPTFIMKSLNGDLLNLEKLSGYFVLLHFQLTVKPPIFNLSRFDSFDSEVGVLKKNIPLETITIFQGGQREIESILEPSQYQTQIVPDGRGFSMRYQIVDYPSFMLIDQQGRLIGYYKRDEWEKLKSDLNKN